VSGARAGTATGVEAKREAVRQLVGVLDLSFESLPGVVEARQRIELRMRS